MLGRLLRGCELDAPFHGGHSLPGGIGSESALSSLRADVLLLLRICWDKGSLSSFLTSASTPSVGFVHVQRLCYNVGFSLFPFHSTVLVSFTYFHVSIPLPHSALFGSAVEFLEENIVGSVCIISLLLWLPIAIPLWIYVSESPPLPPSLPPLPPSPSL